MVISTKIKKKLEKLKDNNEKIIFLEKLIKETKNNELIKELEELLKELKLEVPIEENIEETIIESPITPSQKITPFTPEIEEPRPRTESLESRLEDVEPKTTPKKDYFMTQTYVTGITGNRELQEAVKKDLKRRHLISPSHPEQRREVFEVLEKYNISDMQAEKYISSIPNIMYESKSDFSQPSDVREIIDSINKEKDKKYLRKK